MATSADLYFVNEIFTSLQGEGMLSGRPVVFVRFSRCNLNCSFCDTNFSEERTMHASEIISDILRIGGNLRQVILTGGEPFYQNLLPLCHMLSQKEYFVQVETNGMLPVPKEIHERKLIKWYTVSPKTPNFIGLFSEFSKKSGKAPEKIDISELKVLWEGIEHTEKYERFREVAGAMYNHLVPIDRRKKTLEINYLNQTLYKDVAEIIKYIFVNPVWQLGLQNHKIWRVK